MAREKYRLTVRHGPRVTRNAFEDLDDAIAELRRQVGAIRGEGNLATAHGFREYPPKELVHARLELSIGGPLRGREAGIDVMGDGALVAYRGVIRKQTLEPGDGADAVDAVREALR